jgi:hypothetical protein
MRLRNCLRISDSRPTVSTALACRSTSSKLPSVSANAAPSNSSSPVPAPGRTAMVRLPSTAPEKRYNMSVRERDGSAVALQHHVLHPESNGDRPIPQHAIVWVRIRHRRPFARNLNRRLHRRNRQSHGQLDIFLAGRHRLLGRLESAGLDDDGVPAGAASSAVKSPDPSETPGARNIPWEAGRRETGAPAIPAPFGSLTEMRRVPPGIAPIPASAQPMVRAAAASYRIDLSGFQGNGEQAPAGKLRPRRCWTGAGFAPPSERRTPVGIRRMEAPLPE